MTYLVRQADVKAYSPANHTGTKNFRLIGPESVGAKQLEVIVGELEKGEGALPHLHTGIEQVCYLLEGSAHVKSAMRNSRCRPARPASSPPA